MIIWSRPLAQDESWELPELIPVPAAAIDKLIDFRMNIYIYIYAAK